MNKVFLIGRLTKDVELRVTQTGKPVASFSIAVDKRNRNDGADFFECVAWNGTAEAMERYVHKGSKVSIVGRLQTRNFTNRDGVKVYVTEVVAEEVEFLDPRKAAEPTQQQPSPEKFVETDEEKGLPF